MSIHRKDVCLLIVMSLLMIDESIKLNLKSQATIVSAFSVIHQHKTTTRQHKQRQCHNTFYHTTRTASSVQTLLLMSSSTSSSSSSSSSSEQQEVHGTSISQDEDKNSIRFSDDEIDAESILRIQKRELEDRNKKSASSKQQQQQQRGGGGFSFSTLQRMREGDNDNNDETMSNGIASSYSVAAEKGTTTQTQTGKTTTTINSSVVSTISKTKIIGNDDATTIKKKLLSTEENVQNLHDKVTSILGAPTTTLSTGTVTGTSITETNMNTIDNFTTNLSLEIIDSVTQNTNNVVSLESSATRTSTGSISDISTSTVEHSKEVQQDLHYMRMAINLALEDDGELGERSSFPNPTVGAVLVSYDEQTGEPYVLASGRSDYRIDAIRACLSAIPDVDIAPFQEWAVSWPANPKLRHALKVSTLYVTLEPSNSRQGTAIPPLTSLIRQVGIHRVVIGCTDPVPEYNLIGSKVLHTAGIQVTTNVLQKYDPTLYELCQSTIAEYTIRSGSKLQRMARKHFEQFNRPLGFLHCSVVASDDIEAFARHGNNFGTKIGNDLLNFRNRGAYELAPPPDVIWADENSDNNSIIGDDSASSFIDVDFEDENYQGDMTVGTPMMPWYEQVDAVVATFPRAGNGSPDDSSIASRLKGLQWLATHGNELPAGVERILVMDATDLQDLPLYNSDSNLPKNVDVESFWKGTNRKPTRVLLRRGLNDSARAAAVAAAEAANAAAKAAMEAAAAIESGDAESAAQAAVECQKTAERSAAFIQRELLRTQELRRTLEEKYGVIVETIEGGEPLDVMKHLGERNGMHSIVWRAGCWGDRGVQAVMAGAFQWISAHLTVDAVGGRFWQLMIAENAVQAACGPESKVKIFADTEDISMEYCDEPEVDDDCVLTYDGRPVRHVRLDCRVGLIDMNRPREFSIFKTAKITPKILTEEAPWFL